MRRSSHFFSRKPQLKQRVTERGKSVRNVGRDGEVRRCVQHVRSDGAEQSNSREAKAFPQVHGLRLHVPRLFQCGSSHPPLPRSRERILRPQRVRPRHLLDRRPRHFKGLTRRPPPPQLAERRRHRRRKCRKLLSRRHRGNAATRIAI